MRRCVILVCGIARQRSTVSEIRERVQEIAVPKYVEVAQPVPKPKVFHNISDLGQRIFQHPFSWKAAGVDVRGRSKTPKINYRTS
jgi:hypothetical protein